MDTFFRDQYVMFSFTCPWFLAHDARRFYIQWFLEEDVLADVDITLENLLMRRIEIRANVAGMAIEELPRFVAKLSKSYTSWLNE